MADPNTEPTSDQEIMDLIAKTLGVGSNTATPANEWVDWIDPRTGEVIGIQNPKTGATKLYPKQPAPTAPPSPSAQATTSKMAVDPGTVEWAGYSPVAMQSTGGISRNLDAYDQFSVLQGKIEEMQAKRDELARLSDPKLQSEPGDAAGMQRELAKVDKDLAGYMQQLQIVAVKNKFAFGGSGGGSAPAFSGTAEGIRLAAELDIAKQTLGSDQDLSRSLVVQGQAFDLNMIRDKAQAEQRTAEALAQAEQGKAQFEAEQKMLRAQLYDDIRLGLKTTVQGKAELDQWTSQVSADYQDHVQRIHDIDEYNRNLPQLQAQEDRAARQDQRETNAPKVAALKGQADAGMSAADRMVKLGVSPSDASLRMAYDPYPRMWRILNEKPAAGPQLQTQVAPAAPTPRPMPNVVPSSLVAPAAPGAGITAPPAPYGGDLGAQAAFEAEYPADQGNDPEAIWREQNAANRAPAAPRR